MTYLLNNKSFIYEEKDFFKHGKYPSFYNKTEYGYVAFFVINRDSNVIDFAVFDSKKKLITLVDNIGLIIENIEDQELFVNKLIQKDYTPYKK